MNELTPLQGAELAVRQAERQDDYLALALQTTQMQAATLAVQAQALAQVSTQAPARQGTTAGKVFAYTGAGCAAALVLTAVFMSLAITAMALGVCSPVLWKIYKEMKGKS